MADIIAETDRLILRTIEEGDAAEQDRVLNTPTVMARLGGVKLAFCVYTGYLCPLAQAAQTSFGPVN